jgi:Zn finger protein HypA/HybF involved in hydrogenase expression
MIIDFCEKCKNKIPIPFLTEKDKDFLLSQIRIDRTLYAMQFLKEEKDLGLKECKLFVEHTSKQFGKCHNCNYDNLKNEYEICPKCKSLNINWK